MIYEEAKEKLKGLGVILLTPWTKDYEVDFDGLRQNVDFLIDSGIVEGKGSLFVACGCGEGPFMSMDEAKDVTKVVVEEADGRVPVVIGIFQRDINSAIKLLKFGEKVGAIGAQVVPPYYKSPTLDEIFNFFEKLNASTELGIVVYNNYYSTGTDMPTDFVGRLATLEKVVGFKWTSANRANALYAMAKFNERFNFYANDVVMMVWGGMVGMKGIISLLANIAPKYELKLWELIERGDYRGALEHMMKLSFPLYQWFYTRGMEENSPRGSVGIARAWKAAAEICGLPSGGVRPPQRPLKENLKTELKEILIKGGVIED